MQTYIELESFDALSVLKHSLEVTHLGHIQPWKLCILPSSSDHAHVIKHLATLMMNSEPSLVEESKAPDGSN
jgi:hypothetical protein